MHAAFLDVPNELANSRRTLERIPQDRFGWRPHDKSWTIGSLGIHLARVPYWGTATLGADEFDLATLPPPGDGGVTSVDQILALFDENAAALTQALAQADDARLGATWTLRRGDHVIMRMPRALAVRTNCVSHLIHHRAQLTVYLRLLDVPVPGLYGPSADER